MIKNNKWQMVTFCIRSKVFSADEITRRLGIKPDSYCEIGEPFSKRNPNSKQRDETLWELNSGLDTSSSLVDQIEAILKILENNISSLQEICSDCYIDFFCGYFCDYGQGTFELDNGTLRSISQIGASLVMDLYPPEST